jgi:hypothetical protein
VIAITSKGFCNCRCLAGPRRSGCKIFWSSAVPSGVKPDDQLDARDETGRESRLTTEFDLPNELEGGLFRVDVVSLDLRVEESDLAGLSAVALAMRS